MTTRTGQLASMNRISITALSRSVNRPPVVLAAVAIALALGATKHPYLQFLRPLGDFYVALLQMCVLPFLLATIPLAVRSAMTSGSGGSLVLTLAICLLGTIIAVALIGITVPSFFFHFAQIDEQAIARIGALVGGSATRVDVEFALDLSRAVGTVADRPSGVAALVPTNIFASLAGNDSVRVLVFAAIFGAGMVATERSSGHSVFGALRHIQEVCILIFDWFNLLVPVGIVALIAPQVARLGPDVYAVLAVFAVALLATSLLIFAAIIGLICLTLRVGPLTATANILGPLLLAAATSNTLICIPLALDTMKEKFRIDRQLCDLYIPLGFATIRFGSILYFSITTLFMGMLLGRGFDIGDLILIAALSILASFATLGTSGVAALAPVATVLRPFGLSYELAVPLMIVIEPVANMLRTMLNVGVNCLIPALASTHRPTGVGSASAK